MTDPPVSAPLTQPGEPIATAAPVEVCPNARRHHEAGKQFQQGTASYKTDQLRAEYRRGYEGDQRSCDYCWPPCPSCGHRERRSVRVREVNNAR